MTALAPHGRGTAAPAGTAGPDAAQPPGFGAVLRYFLRLGTSGFGGPIAVVGYMQRDLVEQRVPQMIRILGTASDDLPVIWDADFLFGPKTAAGDDTYVLCEINVSAVWPFPPIAAPAVAAAALGRTQAARALRASTPLPTSRTRT